MGRATIRISADFLKVGISQPGEIISVVSNDVPADAVVISGNYDPYTDSIVVVVESDSLPKCPEGMQLTRIDGPKFQVAYVAKQAARVREFI